MSWNEVPSKETTDRDIEGVHYACERAGCGYEGNLIPAEWDTRDWARVVCPRCFEPDWKKTYE